MEAEDVSPCSEEPAEKALSSHLSLCPQSDLCPSSFQSNFSACIATTHTLATL
jgi:hypothetical protein